MNQATHCIDESKAQVSNTFLREQPGPLLPQYLPSSLPLFRDPSLSVHSSSSCETISAHIVADANSNTEPTQDTHCFTTLFSTIATSLYVSNLVVLTSLTKYSNPSFYESQKGLPPLIADHIYLLPLLYSLSPQSAYVLEDACIFEDDNLSPKVCTRQPPVRQYLWYPASTAVNDVADYYCTIIV